MTANTMHTILAAFALLLVAVSPAVAASRLGGSGRKLQVVSSCFSGSVMVDTKDKGPVAMQDLQVGDYILSNAEEESYQRVYSFAHCLPNDKEDFLVVHTDMDDQRNPNKLEITEDQLVFVEGKTTPVRAMTLDVGDKLTSGATITKISTTSKTGSYTPMTADGTFLVNGNKMSFYYLDTTWEYEEISFWSGDFEARQPEKILAIFTLLAFFCCSYRTIKNMSHSPGTPL